MFENISDYIKTIFTEYLLGLLVGSGIILAFVFARIIPKDRFPVESKISMFVGFFYIALGVVMYILTWFVD